MPPPEPFTGRPPKPPATERPASESPASERRYHRSSAGAATFDTWAATGRARRAGWWEAPQHTDQARSRREPPSRRPDVPACRPVCRASRRVRASGDVVRCVRINICVRRNSFRENSYRRPPAGTNKHVSGRRVSDSRSAEQEHGDVCGGWGGRAGAALCRNHACETVYKTPKCKKIGGPLSKNQLLLGADPVTVHGA